MAADPLIDASMIYLHETKLEDAVSSALVTVVNERASRPRERMAELLLASGNGKSVVTSKAHRELELRVAALESEKAALQKLRERDAALHAELEEQATALLAENEQLSSRCSLLEERGAELERWMREAVGSAAGLNGNGSGGGSSSHAAGKRPDATGPMAGVLARLFDTLLPPDGSGGARRLGPNRIHAFARALEHACAESDNGAEKTAMTRFITVLRGMAKGGGVEGYRREEWLNYAPPDGSYSNEQQRGTVCDVMNAILGNEDARKGLIEATNEEEVAINSSSSRRGGGGGGGGGAAGSKAAAAAPSAGGYSRMMTRLFEEISQGGALTSRRILAFTRALKAAQSASAGSSTESERDAVQAFIGVLERAAGSKSSYTLQVNARIRPYACACVCAARLTRVCLSACVCVYALGSCVCALAADQEWNAHQPAPKAFTTEEQLTFVGILTTILESSEAVEGLLETMAEQP